MAHPYPDTGKNRQERFEELVQSLRSDPKVLRMKGFTQHGRVSTYDHCLDVARTSYGLGKLLHIPFRERELVRGALLHDYFLYDWHHHDEKWHGFTHAMTAAKNARRDFSISQVENNIIESHMWPLNITSLPRCREAVLVCLADKFCSLKETLLRRSHGRGDQ